MLFYALRNYQQKINFSASASGDGYAIAVSAATTAGWAPGTYEWIAYVTLGAERHTVASGEIDITPNMALDAPVDSRSFNRRRYDKICAQLEAREDVIEYTIGGRSARKEEIANLEAQKNRYAMLLKREESGDTGGIGMVRARFTDAQ